MEEKDNTRKYIAISLITIGVLLMSYVAVRIPEARNEALVAVSSWVSTVIVFYFAGSRRT